MKTAEQLNKIYSILVKFGGANEALREDFVLNHLSSCPCGEWRFCGTLGFGGKYRIENNRVDCYSEDLTKERQKTIIKVNEELAKIN